MKLKTKIIVTFTLVASLSVAAVSFAGYYFAKKQLAQNAQEQMKAAVDGYSNRITGWLDGKKQVIQATKQIVEATAGNSYLSTSLLAAQKSDDTFLAIYASYGDGNYFDSTDWVPPVDYNPHTRDWYKMATAGHSFIYTAPYVDADTKKYVVTMAVPVKNAAGAEVAVLAGDILLTTIADMVKTFRPYEESYAFLLDQNGVMIAHPDEAKLSAKIQEDSEFKAVAGEITTRHEGFMTLPASNGTNLVMYTQIPATQWILALVVPEAVSYTSLWLHLSCTLP